MSHGLPCIKCSSLFHVLQHTGASHVGHRDCSQSHSSQHSEAPQAPQVAGSAAEEHTAQWLLRSGHGRSLALDSDRAAEGCLELLPWQLLTHRPSSHGRQRWSVFQECSFRKGGSLAAAQDRLLLGGAQRSLAAPPSCCRPGEPASARAAQRGSASRSAHGAPCPSEPP